MISNEKVINYKVVDLIEIYNFSIKFVFIRLCLEKLWILLWCTITHHRRFVLWTVSEIIFTTSSCYETLVNIGAIITAGWLHEPAVITNHYRWFVLASGGDGDPFLTATLFYEPVVKITFTNCWTYACSTIKFIKFSNKVGWKQTLYPICISRWDLQLCSWWLFHLKSFMVP